MSHSLTPPFILHAVAAGEGEGRLAAVCLFVDISGFTPLTTALMQHGAEGAEIVAQVLAHVFTPLIEIVYAHGGFVAGFAGDAFKAIFPALGNDTHQRAVTAAWQIRQHLAADPTQHTRFGAFPLAVKVTIGSGSVIWRIWQGDGTATAWAPQSAAQQAGAFFGGEAIEEAMAADPYTQAGDVVMTAQVAAQLPATGVTWAAVGDYCRLQEWTVEPLSPPSITHYPLAAPHTAAWLNMTEARFFPADLLTRQIQGEFRQVVTVFINLQSLPPVANAFASALFRLLAQSGGYLCRIGQSGDKDRGGATLLLFWGAPVSHEDDVMHALTFLLALQAVTPVPLRGGVTTNLAYAGFVGSARAEEYTCYGTHVNLAARQMTMAGWGEIWLDQETTRLAGAAFEVIEQGRFRFKGFADVRLVYRLLRPREFNAASFYPGGMVGRQAELAQLQAFLAPLFAGKCCGTALIIGEAGMGKSRLVYELQRQLEDDKVTRWLGDKVSHESSAPVTLSPPHPVTLPQWFRCQTDEILRQPLNPFRYWLRSYFHQATSADEATNKAAFTAKLDELLVRLAPNEGAAHEQAKSQSLKSEIDRTRAFLGALVDLYWPASLYEQVEPQLRFENTLAALKALILAESLCRPVILHLEDAHWLDSDSHVFLTRLLHNGADYPLAVIVTKRPVEETRRQGDWEIGDWRLESFAEPQMVIRLTTLNEGEITTLAAAQLQGAPAPGLVTLLLERAEGNPFFAEQLLRYLQEEEWLTDGPAGWQLRSEQTTPALLPGGARALLVARLDRLPQPVKEVVQTAAVLGREFDTQVLAQMLADDTTLAAKLAVAGQAAIWSAMNQARYLFRHALLREAAYDMQLRARLRSLHQRAAEALQALFTERLDPYYADLAYHYDRAEVAEQAATWYGRAGEQAASSYANRDALHYFSRALALTPAEQAEVRFNLLLGREAIYDIVGDSEAKQCDILTLMTLADHLDHNNFRAQATLCRVSHLHLISNYPEALVAVQYAVQCAAQTNNQYLLTRAHYLWGRSYWLQGDYINGQTHVEQALHIAKACGDRKGEAECLADLGAINFYQGRYAVAQTDYKKALDIYTDVGERKGEISALAMLGTLTTEMGNYERAINHFQQSLEKCRAIGYAYGEAFTLGNLGMNHIYVGEYEKARQCLLQAIASCQERGDRQSEGVYLDSLAVIDQHWGDYKLAAATCRQALAIQQAISDRRFEAYSLTYLGDALRELGDLTEAAMCYQEALAIRQTLGEEKLSLETRLGLAQLALRQQDIPVALTHVTNVLDWIALHGIEGIEFPIQLYVNSYKVLVAAGESERAMVTLLAGYELLQQRAARLQDVRLQQTFVQAVPFNRELLAIWQQRQPYASFP